MARLARKARDFVTGTSDVADGRLRAAQVTAIDRFVPTVMLANVTVTVALTALLFQEHGLILSCWCALVIAASLIRTVQSRRAVAVLRQKAGQLAIVRSIVQAVAMSLVSSGIPAWLLVHTSGVPFAIVVCHLTGSLWAGALVLSTVIPAAAAYAVIMVALIDGALLTTGLHVEVAFLAALVVLGAGTALRSAVGLSRLFSSGHRQRADLERQGEVISILLKDYEEQTSDWLWEIDEKLRFHKPSKRLCEALGRTPEAVAERHFGTFLVQPEVTGNDQAIAQLNTCAAERRAFRDVIIPLTIRGQTRWWSVSGRPAFDEGRFVGFRGVTSDITAARAAQDRISHLAHHDVLTNLPNRTAFCEALDRALCHPERSRLAILSLDLDGFKPVNDCYGHPVGDSLLVMVAERLRANIQPDDLVARFGGDEFLVLVDRPAGVDAVEVLCRRLVDAMAEPFEIHDAKLVVGIGISVGVAFAPSDARDHDELIRNADSALYRAKADGRGTFRFFEPEMDRHLQNRQHLINDLRSALTNGELELHFQPFVDAKLGIVTGCEALLRWNHPTRGLIAPNDFIPLAEETRLIVSIGAWVMREACMQAARWPSRHRVSVNVSPVQFQDGSLPSTIREALAEAGLSPDRLEVEITETVLVKDSDAALNILRLIREMGVRVALDDFGTGYSSLSYLRSFPFDKVKIDRSFVKDLVSRRDDQVVVQAIRDLATGLGMSITAEGVETKDQAEKLRETGCEELQGYLFSRPIPSKQYLATFTMLSSSAA